jgi:hypothetical protein
MGARGPPTLIETPLFVIMPNVLSRLDKDTNQGAGRTSGNREALRFIGRNG